MFHSHTPDCITYAYVYDSILEPDTWSDGVSRYKLDSGNLLISETVCVFFQLSWAILQIILFDFNAGLDWQLSLPHKYKHLNGWMENLISKINFSLVWQNDIVR